MANLTALQAEYDTLAPVAEQFADELSRQLTRLAEDAGVALAFPVQRRVKTWESISDKLARLSLSVKTLTDIQDFVGARLILQFKRDVDKVSELVRRRFDCVTQRDTSQRLREDQFGYASIHLVVTVPEHWLAVPTLTRMRGLRAEIQIRTAAQHIWAVASHVLQYKREQSVPPSIRRAIHRVSALLETVDLEFERVLAEREAYRDNAGVLSHEALNVDLLERTLDALLPSVNKLPGHEDYAGLLEELGKVGVMTTKDLTMLIDAHRAEILRDDTEILRFMLAHDFQKNPLFRERLEKGAGLTHVGLTRVAIKRAFPK